jgi:hypothetical protein
VRRKRLRILTWHVHGNYLYYLTQVPHDFLVLVDERRSPGYAGCGGRLPWGANVTEIPLAAVAKTEFDCVLYQSRIGWTRDRETLLSRTQQGLPRVYLEHDPPQEHPSDTRHFVDDSETLLVHCTPFNELMWDSGTTPTAVIEHGVDLIKPARFTGELPRGVVVVNHLRPRGRRVGADLFEKARNAVPLDLVGMGAQSAGGIGEIDNTLLAQHVARYRFYFNPTRWTSLGLSIIEAMMVGLPVVGFATTELSTVIRNGESGFIDTRMDRLIEGMLYLIDSPREAERMGEAARHVAQERFNIQRFVADWTILFDSVTA